MKLDYKSETTTKSKFFQYMLPVSISLMFLSGVANAAPSHATDHVSDKLIAEQRQALAISTQSAGYGPQSPRDINSVEGKNNRLFRAAPAFTEMNLCNIHFHENAEHKGGEFAKYAGNGDGSGYKTGYEYSGQLSAKELAPLDKKIGLSEHGDLTPGDTIEVHYVHTTAQVTPGPTLGSCLSEAINNPQLRVETQVYVLVHDSTALSFVDLTKHEINDGVHQAINIPTNTGAPIQYEGSTTGPGYNEKGSPFQVSWSVRPKIAKVDIETVDSWFKDNVFEENHAHGVRNLVVNPDLLSKIE